MKNLLIKKSVYAGGYILLAIIIECITFSVMGIGVLPQHFGLDMAVLLIFGLIIFILPHSVAQLIVVLALLFVQMLISIINVSLYTMSGMVFNLGMLNLAKEVTGVLDASFLNWWLIGGFIALFLATMAGLIVLHKKLTVPKGLYTRNVLIIMLSGFLIAECFAGLFYGSVVNSFSAFAEDVSENPVSIFYDEKELYSDQIFAAKALMKFGTFGYYVVNVANYLSSETYVDDVTVSDIDEYFAEGDMSSDVYGDNIYTGAIDGKNIVLIVIESGEWYAINKEYTPTLYAMAEQGVAATNFHARDKTNCSEALSVMGSYPSITQLEPVNVLNNEMSYALPKILNDDGGYTTNYFHINSGDYYNRRSIFGGLYDYDNYYFLEDLDMLEGHATKQNFYDFDKDSDVFRYYSDKFTYSDSEDKPFFTQMMTLTTHGRYTDLINYGNYPYKDYPEYQGDKASELMTEEEKAEFSEKCDVDNMEEYYELIDSFPSTYVEGTIGINESYLEEIGRYSELFLRYKRYQAGMMDLDLGVNMLVNDLIESGKINDTMFVFYADHSAYYNQMNYAMKGIDTSENYNTDVYSVPCFMWYGGSMDLNVEALPLEEYSNISFTASKDTDSALQSCKITKFSDTLDILPTILHLTGYSYNMNLYQGVSMFSDVKRLFVSHESGIFTDDIYFSTINIYKRENGKWVTYDFETTYKQGDFDEDVIEFLNQAAEFYRRQKFLDAVVHNDYFAERNIFGGYSYDGTAITYLQKISQ